MLQYEHRSTIVREDQQQVQSGFTYNLNAMSQYETDLSLSEILQIMDTLGLQKRFSLVRGGQWFTTHDNYTALVQHLRRT